MYTVAVYVLKLFHLVIKFPNNNTKSAVVLSSQHTQSLEHICVQSWMLSISISCHPPGRGKTKIQLFVVILYWSEPGMTWSSRWSPAVSRLSCCRNHHWNWSRVGCPIRYDLGISETVFSANHLTDTDKWWCSGGPHIIMTAICPLSCTDYTIMGWLLMWLLGPVYAQSNDFLKW